MAMARIWPTSDDAQSVAKALIEIAGPKGVQTNTDEGLAFDVEEWVLQEYFEKYLGKKIEGDYLVPVNPVVTAVDGNSIPTETIGDHSGERKPFDPYAFTVPEVIDYLSQSDEAEQKRVLALELSNRARKMVTGWKPNK